ncbi:hypothetical protein ABI_33410 [Asticcacaulis biprosthecium C19]|uniref:DUF1353 domain-containing protein n=1 Tax=Asticcacaulis biprosthecium C19 TaxID=715226 RepID=F4QQ36_9CAUL|nr:hypothetical protein ABI_33410 [Asticcacaulis biprosthecium C19]
MSSYRFRFSVRSLPLLAAASLALTACATTTTTQTTVYVPVAPVVTPSSLTPQPVILFNKTKNGRKLFTLNEEFPYCDPGTGKVIVVPRWYVTDFASVPWFGQGVIDPQGPTARAAIIHDYLYAIGETGKREEADDIFYRAMINFGVTEWTARTAYTAVRTGGEKGYGLKDDWSFINPTQPDKAQPAPFAKPKTGAVRVMSKCIGFKELIQTGWRAYPIVTPVLNVPASVTVTEKTGPTDWVQDKLPWPKKKKDEKK